jgi:ribosome biogenesis GTPase
LELFALDGGGQIVDTPGMRAFGLWQLGDSDLAAYFPEMRPFLGRCKFGLSCRHESEPGCAIKAAVSHGEVSEQRYLSLHRLRS